MNIDFDCHTHSELSPCAEDITLDKAFSLAQKKNLRFVVSDHSFAFYFPKEILRREGERLFTTKAGVELFQKQKEKGREKILKHFKRIKKYKERAICGAEIDILPDGDLIFEEDLLSSIVTIGSVHFVSTENKIKEFKEKSELFMSLGFKILAHPFRLLLQKGENVDDKLILWLVKKAEKYNIALEINSHLPFPEIDTKMVKSCLEKGVRIAISTDSHRLSEFGDFSYHKRILSPFPEKEIEGILYKPYIL